MNIYQVHSIYMIGTDKPHTILYMVHVPIDTLYLKQSVSDQ
jgi:hypothetical protein